MENFEEKAAACTLNRIFGFKPARARALTGRLGSAAAVFRLSREEKEAVFGPGSPYPCFRCVDNLVMRDTVFNVL